MTLLSLKILERPLLLVLPVLSMIVSCGRTNFIEGVPVRLVKAEKTLDLACDSSFTGTFSECLQCVDLSVESDSVLVLREMENSSRDFRYFKCWSLSDYSYLGSFVRRGRGPGEVLMPNFAGSFLSDETGGELSCIADISLSKLFSVDFPLSISSGETQSSLMCTLPEQTLYARPLDGNVMYVEYIDNDILRCRIMDMNGSILNDYDIYGRFSALSCVYQLSHGLLVNRAKGLAASVMMSLPQMNILNLESGDVSSFAVDREFGNWRKIIRPQHPDEIMKSIEYYQSADASDDYIFAVYAGMPIRELVNRKDTHLHIYDWSGRLLYDVTLPEVLHSIAFDANAEMLYGLNRDENRIYRYDLSGLV